MNPSAFEERYARYLAGEMGDEERRAFEQEVADDPELSEEVYADLALGDAVQRGRIAAVPRHWWRWVAPLAAAAIVLLAINLRDPGTPEPVMRGAADTLEIVAPAGVVADLPARFEWTAVEGAARYRFELLDIDARLLHRTVVDEPFVVLDHDVPPSGTWRVVALDELGSELASSAAIDFEVKD